jgi:purine-nucleoside phosphorylase
MEMVKSTLNVISTNMSNTASNLRKLAVSCEIVGLNELSTKLNKEALNIYKDIDTLTDYKLKLKQKDD